MSFVNDVVSEIAERGNEEIADRGPGVIADFVERGKSEKATVAEVVSDLLPGSETITEDAVVEVLDLVGAHSSTFAGLSAMAFTQIAGHFHEDEKEKARNKHVARLATLDEASAWITSGGDAVQNEREARDKLWAEAESFLASLGKTGLKILVAVGKLLIFPI